MFKQRWGASALVVVLLAASPATADPKPAEAALASLVMPGLGQALNGEEGKGLLVFGGMAILSSLAAGEALDALGTAMASVFDDKDYQDHYYSDLYFTAALGLWVYQIYDAYSVARKHQRKGRVRHRSLTADLTPLRLPHLQARLGLLRLDAPGVIVRARF